MSGVRRSACMPEAQLDLFEALIGAVALIRADLQEIETLATGASEREAHIRARARRANERAAEWQRREMLSAEYPWRRNQ